jgi:hypothetical protein
MRGVHSSLMMMLYDEQLDVFPTRPAPPSQHAEFWSCPLRQIILNSSSRVPSCFFPLCNRFPRLGCHLVGSGVLAERIYKLAEGVHEVEEDAGSLVSQIAIQAFTRMVAEKRDVRNGYVGFARGRGTIHTCDRRDNPHPPWRRVVSKSRLYTTCKPF